MKTQVLHNRQEIEAFLRKQPYLHIYALGDLDDFFWPSTVWYGNISENGIENIALLYLADGHPIVLGLCSSINCSGMRSLLSDLRKVLPSRFYAHLSPGLVDALSPSYLIETGEFFKMALLDKPAAGEEDTNITLLGPSDEEELLDLYGKSYPGNFFQPRMLQTGKYLGYRIQKELLGVAGVHVYSPRYKVAALGNITTHPSARGRGIGRKLTRQLCLDLLPEMEYIGLNVKSSNKTAISIYGSLGFETVAAYREYEIALDHTP